MIEELYSIYKECFQNSLISKEEFERKLDFNDAKVFKRIDENGVITGFSVVRENCISMICVRPSNQNKGIGTSLLKESEEYIKSNGYNEILLGYKSDKTSLYDGVPILHNDNHSFFSNHEYDSDFTSYDLKLSIKNEDIQKNDEYTTISTTKFQNVKNMFFQILEVTDKKFYERYYLEDDIDFIFCRRNGKLSGVCAFSVMLDQDSIIIHDLISYPNFDVNPKKAMMKDITEIQSLNNINNVCVKNVSNPVLYQNEFNGSIKEKYWRGSKSC